MKAIYDCIQQARFSLSTSAWSRVSEPAKDLVRKLLTTSIADRLTAEECLKHPWIADKTLPPRVHLNETVDNIRKYNFRRKLKSNIIATANNTKWNRFPVNSYLSADSMPGGDACDFDCSLRKPEISSGEDMYGVQMVLSSLDKMSVLSDYCISSAKDESASNKTLESALKDQQLHEILLVGVTFINNSQNKKIAKLKLLLK